MRITAEEDLAALKRKYDRMTIRHLGSGLLLMVGLLVTSIAAGKFLEDYRQSQRAAPCTATMQRLLAADTLVALEREKFLLKEMDCSIWRQVREMQPMGG